MLTLYRRLLAEEDGATAIEYTIIAALISLAAVVAFASLGLNLADILTTIVDTLAGSNTL